MDEHLTDTPIVDIAEAITAGDDYSYTFTLARDDGATAALDGTITASIVAQSDPETELLSDVDLEISDANNRLATLELDAASTALLRTVQSFHKSVLHLADIKNVEAGGNTVHYGPFRFPVRRAIT
ncbi:MAG TPA: hypothetical protein VGA20_04335 [Gemmatimonadales bacterium]